MYSLMISMLHVDIHTMSCSGIFAFVYMYSDQSLTSTHTGVLRDCYTCIYSI